ncbi:TetR/AcrR family transcriptional regulator [Arthrobacter sp. Sa2BUA2]|uniref:TetR/AcrR family transcriptional regulator n=1 Tax=Arthrobacter pullicola TaxID=2762224 RepID=A0ABR8YFZ1_9MICC|nr:TetR/AcrR family transcriptional regulator [Arthrobacter pullicola]MBD8043139.1 TetR/AcrR family transcriptional regulator [Arthrobacter pullicola]
MTNSATESGGLRERKRTATRIAITTAARTLTAAHGVNGFTVEELCEEVGISRRTFFNYFPAKEDAILGSPVDDLPEDLVQRFVDGGKGSPSGELSTTLLADFVDLAVGMVDRMAISRSEMIMLKNAIAAEPRLLQKAMHGSQAAEEVFASMLSARESLPTGDPRIRAAITVFGALVQVTGPKFFAPENTVSYRRLLVDAVNSAREVFALSSPLSYPSEDTE